MGTRIPAGRRSGKAGHRDRRARRWTTREALARVGLFAAVVTALTLGFGPGVAGAQEDRAQELADRHAPVMMLRAQDDECDTDGEPYAPMAVDVVLDNPLVFLRQVGPQNPVLMNAPGSSDVFGLGESVFLDFPGDALSPGCVFEEDFRRFTDDDDAVVYAHVVTTDDEPDKLALQYWFFWYYNDWNNKHEGDWEGIQLLFDVGTVEEALRTDPVSVGYAQHEGGERADWDDDKLERRGDRPVVYSSAGSHASYFSPALYLGRSGSEGFGCDVTSGPSVTLDPGVVVLPDTVDDPDDPLAWLGFEGRWGERQAGPFNGPTGPRLKERWVEPFEWHDNLRSTSVVVPGGDTNVDTLVSTFCGVVEFGSAQLILLRQDPVALLLGVVVVFGLASFLLGRTDWSTVPGLPIVERRRAGQIIKAAFWLVVRHPRSMVLIGLAYLPFATVISALVGLLELIPFVEAVLEGERDIGAVGVALTLLIGLVAHVVALSVVTAAVGQLLRDLEQQADRSVADLYRHTYRQLGDVLATVGRGLLIVIVLLLSFVGIPWGVRQFVRYQFLAPIVSLEHERGQGALNRSSELVRGRWFHTAAVIILLSGLAALVAVAAGTLLLVVLSGLPLWLFSILVTLSSALTSPYSATAITLLYGDAAAEAADATPEHRPDRVDA